MMYRNYDDGAARVLFVTPALSLMWQKCKADRYLCFGYESRIRYNLLPGGHIRYRQHSLCVGLWRRILSISLMRRA